jgi:hypothetical protein
VAEVDRHLRGATDGLVAQDAGQCAVRFHRSRGYEKLRWGIWGARLEEARFFRYRFGNKIALRFKKFRSRTLKTSNNNTAQTALFQSQQLEYFDSKIQPMTHVVAGYLLDDLAIDIDRLAVTCTMDGQHIWAPIELVGDSDVRTSSTVDPTTTKPRVRSARKSQKTRQSTSGEE